MVDRGGHVFECRRPAAAVAEPAVLDVPGRKAAAHEIADERAHDDPAVALAPGAAVDEDHQRVGTGAGRKPKVGALRAVGTVAVEFAAREEIEDQTPSVHSRGS